MKARTFVGLAFASVALAAVAYSVSDRAPEGSDPPVIPSGPGAPAAGAHAEGGSLEPSSPAPIGLTGVDAFRMKFKKLPRAALVFDVDSGEVLYRLSPERVLPMASLTKIMTALTVTASSEPDDRVEITKAALRYQGSGIGVLPRGKRVRLETLLTGLMLVSGNDAAIALADHVSGDERHFVALMNEKARLWNLRCTRFADSHGLATANRSCAADLAVLARLAMRDERIARITRRPRAILPFPIKGGKLYLYGHNPLIRNGYRGAIGLKTGYTEAAGRCFIGVARRGGRTLGVVLLHSADPGKHARALLDRAFRAEGAE